ncbi:MAG: polyprenyl synthetase family protein [Treponema sp.]|jgi:octaprenyl-diphosphate synthase|nr:polyprenyl synthetase family protein [Treponema sp.]
MDQEYIQKLEKIEALLKIWLPESPDMGDPHWLASVFSDLPCTISPQLVQSLTIPGRDLLNRGGKRWRPLLMTLICESLGGGERSLPLTPLVEFPHNASLIHDDIEDNSDQRRGEPAIHIRYGIDTAINGGTFLYFLPLSCIEGWNASIEQKHRAFSLWGSYLRRLHLGQAMDIQWHRDFSSLPSLEAYNLMCRLKTGSLARLAVDLGVIAANLGDSVKTDENKTIMDTKEELSEKERTLIENLGEAAEKLGMGFQILDDVKNLTTGNPGKKRGDDIVEGKKSLPVLLYLHQRQDQREFVSRCFSAARTSGTAAPEVEALIEALTQAGSIREAENHGRAYITEAQDVFTSQIGGNLLSGLLDFIETPVKPYRKNPLGLGI